MSVVTTTQEDLEQHYAFLDDGDDKKLRELFLKHMAGGKWELARLSLHQLAALREDLPTQILLDIILRAVPSGWTSTPSIPCPAYVTLFCYNEYVALGGDVASLPQRVIDTARFDALLHSCMELASQEQVQVLLRLKDVAHAAFVRSSGNRIDLRSKLDETGVQHLQELLAVIPLLGHALASSLASHVSGWQSLYMSIIEQLLDGGQFDEACGFLPYVRSKNISESAAQRLTHIFRRLLDAAERKRRRMAAIYQGLLGSPDAAVAMQMFSALEVKQWRAESKAALPLPFQMLRNTLYPRQQQASTAEAAPALPRSEQKESAQNAAAAAAAIVADPARTDKAHRHFWGDFFFLVRASGTHFFEYCLSKMLAAIQANRFDDVATLLLPFPRLKSLVFLMTVDHVVGRGDFQSLLRLANAIFPDLRVARCEIVLDCHCAVLLWVLRAVQWLVKQQVTEESALQLFQDICQKGFLTVLQPVLPAVDRTSLWELLHSFPADLDHSVRAQEMQQAVERAQRMAHAFFLLRDFFASADTAQQAELGEELRWMRSLSDDEMLVEIVETTLSGILATTEDDASHFLLTNLDSARRLVGALHTELASRPRAPEALIHELHELQQRLSFVIDIDSTYASFSTTLLDPKTRMNRVLAAPDTLLLMALRTNRYDLCELIVSHFKLDTRQHAVAHMVRVSKATREVHVALEKGATAAAALDLLSSSGSTGANGKGDDDDDDEEAKHAIFAALSAISLPIDAERSRDVLDLSAQLLAASSSIVGKQRDTIRSLLDTSRALVEKRGQSVYELAISPHHIDLSKASQYLDSVEAVCAALRDVLRHENGNDVVQHLERLQSVLERKGALQWSGGALDAAFVNSDDDVSAFDASGILRAFAAYLASAAALLFEEEALCGLQFLQRDPLQLLLGFASEQQYELAESVARLLGVNLQRLLLMRVGDAGSAGAPLKRQRSQYLDALSGLVLDSSSTKAKQTAQSEGESEAAIGGERENKGGTAKQRTNVEQPATGDTTKGQHVSAAVAEYAAGGSLYLACLLLLTRQRSGSIDQEACNALRERIGRLSPEVRQWFESRLSLVQAFRTAHAVGEGDATQLNASQAAALSALKRASNSGDVKLALHLLDRLRDRGAAQEAIEIGDLYLPGGAPDEVLAASLTGNPQPEHLATVVLRLRDAELAFAHAAQHMREWDLSTTTEVMRAILSRLAEGSPTATQARQRLDRLHAFRDVLASRSGSAEWKDWRELDAACERNVNGVLAKLMGAHCFSLALRVSQLYQSSVSSSAIEEAALQHLMESNGDFLPLLSRIAGSEGDIQLVERVIEKTVDGPKTLTLLEFLMQHPAFPAECLPDLKQHEQGIRALLVLPPELRQKLQHLSRAPNDIVESLLMMERTIELGKLHEALPELFHTEMLLRYAKRALQFSNTALLSVGHGEEVAAPSTDRWILTGRAVEDRALRKQHRYASAPSINLASALLTLCSEHHRAGEFCLETCRSLAAQLVEESEEHHLMILRLIQQLLFHAKLHFSKTEDGSGAGALEVCQTFLSHVELLHALYTADCGVKATLDDLSNPKKARTLRDRLIKLDRMKLANTVATKCQVESEPVWGAWGLQLLRMGLYNEAKDKFVRCFTAPTERRTATPSSYDAAKLLDELVSVLEEGPPLDVKRMREELFEMQRAMESGSASERLAFFTAMQEEEAQGEDLMQRSDGTPSRLSSVRYMQCIFYLTRFGSSAQLLSFWLRNGFLEDAIRYVVSSKLPETVFTQQVLRSALERNQMSVLFRSLVRFRSSRTKMQPYLLHACKFLNEQNDFAALLEFQEFMSDWARAGLTCVKLFHTVQDAQRRIEYLRLAKNHFMNALKALQAANNNNNNNNSNAAAADSVVDEAELTRYYKKVSLQLSISEFLETKRKDRSDVDELYKISMFSTQKAELAEQVIVLGNSDLGFRIIQEFRLPSAAIYAGAARSIAANGNKSQLNSLLKSIKGTIDGEQWDSVVLAVVEAYAKDLGDAKAGEKYISKIFSARLQVRAYTLVGKLKTAYVLAAKNRWPDEVSAVRTAAVQAQSQTVIELCNKFLASY